ALDEIKIFEGALSDLEVLYGFAPDQIKDSLLRNRPDLTQQFIILNRHNDFSRLRDSLHQSRTRLNDLMNQVPEIMVMGDLPQPRTTHVLERGQYDRPGEIVFPDVPSSLNIPFDGFERNRLGLARWLFDDGNALTARVFVNRIWLQHFGRGLVRTAEDFGAQGEIPSHPELLDWLAHWYVRSNWDIKALHKLILTSKTYQRSSSIDLVIRQLDPENKWLARGPSQRLSAEMIRDNALAISDLLVDRLGGTSVYPYQPAGLWDDLSNKSWRYPYLQKPGDGLYRRSLYTIWKRTSPPPSMLLFDVPDRSFCSVQRKQTNTPQQALALLNDPTYVEASRLLAAKIVGLKQEIAPQLNLLFRTITGRHPNPGELKEMHHFYHDELERIYAGELEISGYLTSGEGRIGASYDVQKITALAITAHNLMNTDEALRKR
ncbi:MAG: DUF1553 domain-containing protein, partial [Saprospiraceae bacterium]|nr:DUF1553 domain-containing protein [Saprospiraceae bacterium]